MSKSELEFFDPLAAETAAWVALADQPGMAEMILSVDAETGACTRLLRFEPGADTTAQGTLRHDFWEEVWLLEGSLHDIRLSATFTSGMYACRPPGMPHGPWRAPRGAVTLEFRSAPAARPDATADKKDPDGSGPKVRM